MKILFSNDLASLQDDGFRLISNWDQKLEKFPKLTDDQIIQRGWILLDKKFVFLQDLQSKGHVYDHFDNEWLTILDKYNRCTR